MQRRIRVLVGKPGLDGHDRGAKVVAAALRDAGMEVIYTGLHQTPQQIVEAALQEDVDVVALSILSGAHMTLFPEVLELMRAQGVDALLTGGGIVPPEDMETLAKMGVGRLFGPGSSTQDIVVYIRAWFSERHGEDALTPLPPPRPIETAFSPAPPLGRASQVAHVKAAGSIRARPAATRKSNGSRPATKAARPASARSKSRPASRGNGAKPGRSARPSATARPARVRARAGKSSRPRAGAARATRRTGSRTGRAR